MFSLSVGTNNEAASLSVQGGPRYPYGFIRTSRPRYLYKGWSLVIRNFE